MLELRRRRAAAAAVATAALSALVMLAPRTANAQVHWDASAQVGAMKRFLVERPAGASDAGFGPMGQIEGHVALLPLVHLGGYFGHDSSPLAGDAGRNLTWGGVQARGMIPWVSGLGSPIRMWIFAGFGLTGTYAPSYHRTVSLLTGSGATVPTDVLVQGAGGNFFEVPFGIGGSYRFWKPWSLCAELGARMGFGHSGSVYEDPGPQISVLSVPGQPDQNALPSGLDRFALGLTIGVMIEM